MWYLQDLFSFCVEAFLCCFNYFELLHLLFPFRNFFVLQPWAFLSRKLKLSAGGRQKSAMQCEKSWEIIICCDGKIEKFLLLFFLLLYIETENLLLLHFFSSNLFSTFKKLSIYCIEKNAINFKYFILEHPGVEWVKSTVNQSYKCESVDNET